MALLLFLRDTSIKNDIVLHNVSDNKTTVKVFKVVNLPIPYPEIDGKGGAVAIYRLQTENIAFTITRFIPLTPNGCEANVLGTCQSRSPIYVRNRRKLCIFGLFKGDTEAVKRNCQR